MLANADFLAHPKLDSNLSLLTEASDIGIGVLLNQNVDNWPQSLASVSHNLTPTEKNCRVYHRELLAVYFGVRHFRPFLKDRQFSIN
ncbi:hypothetical protein NPIL_421481 [Nephila pilipes]|uniref:Reverse transcriptase/retrotransposon-derived protein RNase H-like domain-containing protein n=1 Tax=Nephila pilipes TaxID=299642 RepID=A0A8X6Q1G2_NEPPI|nr:hypothetical protein NPIL_421481 [Nephila pilipes]